MSTELKPGETAPYTQREIFFAAPYAVGHGLDTFGKFQDEGLKQTDTISDICDNLDLTETVIGSDKLWPELMLSEVARKEMANRTGSMTSISRRQGRMDDVEDDPIMWEDIYTTEMPSSKWVVGRANLDPETYESFSDVITGEHTMTEIGKSAESRTFIWSTSEITWAEIRLTDMALANVIAGEIDESYPDSISSLNDLLAITDIESEIDSNTTATSMIRDGTLSSAKYAGYIVGTSYEEYSSIYDLASNYSDMLAIFDDEKAINTLYRMGSNDRGSTNTQTHNASNGGTYRIRLRGNGSNNTSTNSNAWASIDDVDVTNANTATINWGLSLGRDSGNNSNNHNYTRGTFAVGNQSISYDARNDSNGNYTDTLDISGEEGRVEIRTNCYMNQTNSNNPSGNVYVYEISLN